MLKLLVIYLAFVSNIAIDVSSSIINKKNVVSKQEKPIIKLEISKINFEGNIYSKNSSLKDIDKNIIIMTESDYPDKENGIVVIGGHSGIGKYAYFKNLNKLDVHDIVTLYYNNNEYIYEVINYYLDDKNGSIIINNSNNKKKLFLYTCNPKDKDNYLVIVLEEKE